MGVSLALTANVQYHDNILFALHYIRFRGASSTVQTEQAMVNRPWGWVADCGSR